MRAQKPFLQVGLVVWLISAVVESRGMEWQTFYPKEETNAVLHNPGMGWVLYENYPLDQQPNGSSTLLTLPNENFDGVDAVAIMFSWQDVEKEPGKFDFSKVDFAYDYWQKRGKEIQLRLSSESLLWWSKASPPSGKGIPDFVLEEIPAEQKQRREMEGLVYDVVDARNQKYQMRLRKFLEAVDAHFGKERPIKLVDLRGFGVWGEWHSGYKYATPEDRREGLKEVIDIWSESFLKKLLLLSYSYDPDGPKELYAGGTRQFERGATNKYSEFVRYSAFDLALRKSNVSFRRDGAGGAVHSNERLFIEEAFTKSKKAGFVCEFVDGYAGSKKGGQKWIEWKVADALSLHPNYINLLGWQGADALAFLQEQPGLIQKGALEMGYRLALKQLSLPKELKAGQKFDIAMEWKNESVGRALENFEIEFLLVDNSGRIIERVHGGPIPTSAWSKGTNYQFTKKVEFSKAGEFELRVGLYSAENYRWIALPHPNGNAEEGYKVGNISIPKP